MRNDATAVLTQKQASKPGPDQEKPHDKRRQKGRK